MNKKTALMLLGCAVALPALSHAAVYDIATDITVTFDSANDTLTNTTSITAWDDTTLKFNDNAGTDIGVDFTALGITSWTTAQFGNTPSTTWDGANLSGLVLTFNVGQFGRSDSMVGTDFSGATINAGGAAYNQPFLFVNAEGANFSGATFNIGNTGNGIFRNAGASDTTTTIRNADFSNITWGVALTTNGANQHFNSGAGATSAADKANAATFEGADLSLITGAAKTTIINNLGAFDGLIAIGAKYDAAMLANSTGWTAVELDAAGWQAIPEPGTYALFAGLIGLAFVMLRRRSA